MIVKKTEAYTILLKKRVRLDSSFLGAILYNASSIALTKFSPLEQGAIQLGLG